MAPDLRRTPSSHVHKVWWIAFAAASLLFIATAGRGAQWQDSGLHQVRIITNNIANSFGIATSHPLHFYLGRLFYICLPVEPGFAISILSAVAASIAVANVLLLVLRLTHNHWASVIAAITLALGQTFWQHATHTESYALVAALLTAEWLCVERILSTRRNRWLIILFFLNGLGVSNHMLAGLASPIDAALLIIVIAKQKSRWRIFAGCAIAWCLGCVPLLEYMFRDYQAGGDLAATIRSTLFGTFADSVLNTSISIRSLAMGAGFIAYNFPGLAIPLAVYGIYRGRTTCPIALRRLLIAEAIIYVLFVMRYAIVDQYSYFFVIYLFVAVFAGLGIGRMNTWMQPRAWRVAIGITLVTSLWTPAVYWMTSRFLERRHIMSAAAGNKPYRNGYRVHFVPWGAGDDHADELNQKIASVVTPDASVIVEDPMIAYGIQYAQSLGRLADSVKVVVANDVPDVRSYIANAIGNVILVPRDRDHPQIEPELPWRRDGDIYMLSK
ncbi:MAG: DUF2723 domain-containing protein [Phycisphaerales bacterium]|nr:DUF2723 domain-containing protein [Phycisphaerales bacterium]MCB9863696.1 DUF2723 domain-containing protein [Phycisphaerales bacterium]